MSRHRHGVGCASLVRRAQCTCGAEQPPRWGLIVTAVAAVVLVVVWLAW